VSEMEALRAYFDAHMEMQEAIDAEKFGRAYVKANAARDRLIQLEQSMRDGHDNHQTDR
jgi:hypothetical protein